MRFFLGFLALVAVLIVGALIAPSFIDIGKYKDQGLEKVKSLTGYDVAVAGDIKVGILPAPHLHARDVSVVNPSSSNEPIATFESLSVGVALAPLFKKQVEVTNVSLVKPVFDLRVDREGKGNWLSDKIQQKQANSGSGPANNDEAGQQAGGQNIAFDQISIENGALSYFDARQNKKTELKDINLSLRADSLQGPFEGEGSLDLNGQNVAFDVETQTLSEDALPLNLQAEYGAYTVSLKGVAGIKQPFDVQGETEIRVDDNALPISQEVVARGILSANQENVALKNSEIEIGDASFDGAATVNLKPLSIKADFEGDDVIDLAKFLPSGSKGGAGDGSSSGATKGGSGDPLLMLTELLPPNVTLPQNFEIDANIKTGGFLYEKALLKGTVLSASKKGQAFDLTLKVDALPGGGPASLDADVVFGSSSVSKSGAKVLSEPKMDFVLQANTQNTAETIKVLTGKNDIPVLSEARIGKFLIKGDAKHGRFALNDSVVNLDDLKVSIDGAVRQGDAKPVLDMKVSSSVDDPYALAKRLDIDTQKWPQNLGAVKLAADLDGSMDNLSTNASVNAFGADVIVSGKVNELISGDALQNLALQVKHPNLAQLLKNIGASAPNYTAMSKPLDASFVLGVDGKTTTLSNIKGRLAGTNVSGGLRLETGSAKPSLSGDLAFGSLTLKTARGGASGGSSGGSSSSSGGKWSSAQMNNGWLHAANANLNVTAEQLDYESWTIGKPSLSMVMSNGVLDIQNLKGGLFGGQVGLQSKVSAASSSAPLNVSTTANIAGVNIGSLAKALSGTSRLNGDGVVSLDFNVSGAGGSQKALIDSLAGSAKLNGSNILLRGFDLLAITNAVENDNRESLLGALKSFSRGSTAFEALNGAYTIKGGVVSINSMTLDGKSASITSSGSASMPQWRIDTQHTVSFNQTDKLDPFTFSIRGPLDKPVSTFANIGQDILRGQAGRFVQEQLQGTGIGDALSRFGILPQAPVNDNGASETEPAAGEGTSDVGNNLQEAQPKRKSSEEQAQEAIEGVLKGLFQ